MSSSAATRQTWMGVGALLLTAGLWSLNGPLIKVLNEQGGGIDGLSIAFYRSLFGGLALLPLALPRVATLRRAATAWPIASVLTFTLMTATFVVATTRTAAANAIILQYSSPIWVVLLSPMLLGERLRRAEGLILFTAMAGVAVIFLGNPVTDRVALTIALASGFGYGTLQITLRGLRRVHPTVVVCLNSMGSAIILAPAAALWGSFRLTGPQFGLLLLLGIVQFALPYLLYSWAARTIEAYRASLITLIEAILNPLWTYLVVGETVPRATLMGAPLILASIAGWLLLTWSRQRRSIAPAPEGAPPPAP